MTSLIKWGWEGLAGWGQARAMSAFRVESSGFLLLLPSQAARVAAPLLFAQALPSVPMAADVLILSRGLLVSERSELQCGQI